MLLVEHYINVINVACDYRMVSYDATCIVAGMVPIDNLLNVQSFGCGNLGNSLVASQHLTAELHWPRH